MDWIRIVILILLILVTVINVVIFIKSKRHYDGIFRINTTDPNKDVYSLELNDILGQLEHMDELRLKIVNESSQEKPRA